MHWGEIFYPTLHIPDLFLGPDSNYRVVLAPVAVPMSLRLFTDGLREPYPVISVLQTYPEAE